VSWYCASVRDIFPSAFAREINGNTLAECLRSPAERPLAATGSICPDA
jgi:hypothetical protein